ncbi:MAG: permease, partial [Spirochaetales bacterium]|nr:permease [Spirochaetales bacterium]
FMTLAYVLEALIILYLPEAWIVSLLGSGNRLAIPLATAVGIPLYTTNLTALGLVGGLLQQGMSPGAALAFLISGATTTIPAMAAVYGIVKGRVFALYLLSTLIISLLAGYAYQLVYNL